VGTDDAVRRPGAPAAAIAEATLRAVIDRIVPADRDPGALDLGADRFVQARLVADPAAARRIAAGLGALEAAAAARHRAGFAALAPEARTALLEAHETEAWFVDLVTLTTWGFYADPDNGGNAGAASWAMIGYRHGLPDGPSGPPARRRDG
jgi:hypothetical protein